MKYKVAKSKIPNADKGLFAKKQIKQGERIGLAHKDGQPVGTLGNMHNHSEEPNMHSIKVGNKRYVYAKRDIKPGEELTTNYRMQPELEQPEDFMRKGGRTRGLVQMPKPSKKGLASKKYSRSLEATNRLFTENRLFKKPKSKKNKVFDPNAKYYQDGGPPNFNIKPSLYTNSNRPDSQIIGANVNMSHKSGLHGNINAEVPFMNRNTAPRSTQDIGIRKKYRNIYGDATLSNYSKPGKLFNPSANLELGYEKNLGKNFVANAGVQNTMMPGSYFNPRVTAGIKYGFEDGGYIDLELDDTQIAQYVKGGYIVEEVNDPAIPALTRAQDGVIVDNLPKPELVQVPRIKINVDPDLDRQSNAAIKKSEYKPVAAEYKGIARPAANFIPAEEASDEMIAELRNSGYYPVKTESGDYEVFSNKDISNAILQKGLSPDEISANLKLGQAQDIKSNFQDVYNYANAAHAKRNKDKIDALIKSGKTKDQAFAILQSQGEGDIKGLQHLYGNYADAVYQNAVNSYNEFLSKKTEKKKDNNDLANIEKNIDASIAQQERKAAEYDAAYQPFFEQAAQNIDWGRSLTPSETTQQVAGTTSAYDVNEEKKYNYIKAKEEVNANKPTISYTEAELAKLILKSDNLTPEQKKQFLSDPEKFDSIYRKYAEYKAEPDIIDDKEFGKTSAPKGEFKILENGNASWTKAEELDINMGQPRYQSGRMDMLDKEYIKLLVAYLGLPTATSVVQAGLTAAPIASLPWLTAQNALVAKGFYDVINTHGPNFINTIEEANTDEKGWTDERIRDAAYSGTKIGLSGIAPLTPLRDIEGFQNLKRTFDLYDSGQHLNKENEEIDPLSHISFLSSVAGLKGYKKGGSKKNHIETTLSKKEIQDYIKRGYIVEELD
jgi:hypothetical protein